ncbi:MAG: ACT domain-containing protein, partial [Deltaproteobacteria bacterium]
MFATVKVQMQVVDRVGVMAEIARTLAADDVNILSMEVDKSEGRTFVYLELQPAADSPAEDVLLGHLSALPDVLDLT